MREVGFAVGRTSTKWITVRLEAEVLLNDLVKVGEKLLGVVRSVSYANPTMSPYSPFTPTNIESVRAYEYLNANIELYGTVEGGKFDPRVLTAIPTGTPVYLIEEGDLEGLSFIENPIFIGEHPTSKWPLPLDPRAIDYHLAVVGSTGSGKSHLVRLLVKELVRVGRKVVIFDHTGADYAPYFRDHVIPDSNVFPDLLSLAEVLANKVLGKEYLDDIEVALYAYLFSNGEYETARMFMESLGFGNRDPDMGPILELMRISPKDVKWDDKSFASILRMVMGYLKRKEHTIAKSLFRLVRSGISMKSFNGREYDIEKLVDHIIDSELTVLDISSETLPIRYGIMRGVISGIMERAESKGKRMDVTIVVDEAQVYARGQPPTESLSDVARRGRKWGIGLILASQRWVSDLDMNIRANINSVLFSSLQSSSDIDDIGKVVNIGNIDVGVLGTGDFYITGLLSPFRRPILIHTFGDLDE
ncbi:MAG TPA: ATP-binding protein [Thermoprotei archaeon]|nr:ATP-binding protein [Thermoprotei archaeon]